MGEVNIPQSPSIKVAPLSVEDDAIADQLDQALEFAVSEDDLLKDHVDQLPETLRALLEHIPVFFAGSDRNMLDKAQNAPVSGSPLNSTKGPANRQALESDVNPSKFVVDSLQQLVSPASRLKFHRPELERVVEGSAAASKVEGTAVEKPVLERGLAAIPVMSGLVERASSDPVVIRQGLDSWRLATAPTAADDTPSQPELVQSIPVARPGATSGIGSTPAEVVGPQPRKQLPGEQRMQTEAAPVEGGGKLVYEFNSPKAFGQVVVQRQEHDSGMRLQISSSDPGLHRELTHHFPAAREPSWRLTQDQGQGGGNGQRYEEEESAEEQSG
ncbi:hypothetical protein C4K00_2121 [Pseudomonas synxantha]|uniref:hypothetical protein n=1 Tax=Pseudomonas synxantha TaxID=47883 RepID=UPI000F56E03E|nr:hypothetical protein [Pseudomonas synxantha]AZE72350.1 hypothetical protein C4K00_2121 [Pseudomonas synxantha]AZE78017.1 hypothetical protein C4J99_2232 [Pseudomonas synxantha]